MSTLFLESKPAPTQKAKYRWLLSLSLRCPLIAFSIIFSLLASLSKEKSLLASFMQAAHDISDNLSIFSWMMAGLTLFFMLIIVAPEAWVIWRSRRQQD